VTLDEVQSLRAQLAEAKEAAKNELQLLRAELADVAVIKEAQVKSLTA
jgi:hypothetical protein